MSVMDVKDRLPLVADLLQRAGRVSVAELSSRTGVSEMTVRRDLERLEQDGLARRVHGGAVSTVSRSFEPPFAARAYRNAPAKRAIGRRAVELLSPGEAVILDAGTTGLEVARALRDGTGSRDGLMVCTLGFQAAAMLLDRPGIRLLVPGGEPRPGEGAFTGETTTRFLGDLRFDTYLMAVGGLTGADGLTDFGLADLEIKRTALGSARRVIVLADSAKFGTVTFARIAGLDVADLVVTDAGISAEHEEWLREAGVEPVVAG
jgi:DeoR/GlpR family transcriptional regulator of sugar metabolism